MLVTGCQDSSTLSSGKIRQIQIGATTREEVIKMIGPAQHNNRAEAVWIESYTAHPSLLTPIENQPKHDLHRVLDIRFSSTNIVKSCDVYVRDIDASNSMHYKCSDF